MKVVVLGADSPLGAAVAAACRAAQFEVREMTTEQMDLTVPAQVRKRMPASDWVINCVKFFRVDEAEQNRAHAFAVNAEGAHAVAATCARRAIRLLHVSVADVFDGRKSRPYTEVDEPHPVNVFGLSCLAGEKAVRAEGGTFIIARIAAVYGWQGDCLARSWLDALKAGRPVLDAPGDERVTPTYVRHAAEAIATLIGSRHHGLVHVASSGRCSWFEFARALAQRVRPDVEVRAINAQTLPRLAPRPLNTMLDTRRFHHWTGRVMPSWEEGLDAFLSEAG